MRVSLAAVSSFLRSLPRIPPNIAFPLKVPSEDIKSSPDITQPEDESNSKTAMSLPAQDSAEIRALSTTIPFAKGDIEADTGVGAKEEEGAPKTLVALKHAAVLSLTPVRVGEAPRSLNAHRPEWLPRTLE